MTNKTNRQSIGGKTNYFQLKTKSCTQQVRLNTLHQLNISEAELKKNFINKIAKGVLVEIKIQNIY